MYDFFQTEDLNNFENKENLNKFKALVKHDKFQKILEDITEIKGITKTVDMFAAIYSNNSYLACHDDKLEGRRIAYIYYLVPEDWSEDDGGL